MTQRNLIITGHQRSGTTPLCDLLNIDGRILVTNELFLYYEPELPARLSWDQTIDRLLPLCERYGLNPEEIFPRNYRNGQLLPWLERSGCEWVGDKGPAGYLLYYEQIRERAHRPRTILCIRDGRDVATNPFFGGAVWPHPAIVESWDKYARVALMLAGKYRDEIMILRYEDATLDPEGTAQRIATHLGMDALDITGHSYAPYHVGRWRDVAPDMMGQLPRTFIESLNIWGYE